MADAPSNSRSTLATAMFGMVLVVEAILRIFIVYHYSVDKLSESFVISQLPGLVLLVAVLVFVRLQVPTISGIVDGIQERLATRSE